MFYNLATAGLFWRHTLSLSFARRSNGAVARAEYYTFGIFHLPYRFTVAPVASKASIAFL